MFTSRIHLSASERQWREFGTGSDVNPPSSCCLQHTTLPPTVKTFLPPPVERIPICPGAKFQPCFLGTQRLALESLPWEDRGLPPRGPKNATNYWGSRQWSLSFNPWQVPLGYYQDVNGRDRAVWHTGDPERLLQWKGRVTSAVFWHWALLNIHQETL